MLEPLVLVDATCDVPDAILHSGSVSLLPVLLELKDGRRLDRRNAADTVAFMQQLESAGPSLGRSETLDVHEMAGVLKARLLAHGKPILALHVSGSRSHTVARIKQAAATLPQAHVPAVAARLQVVDSRSLFAGYGAQLVDVVDQLQRGLDWQALMRRVQRNTLHTHMFLVPSRLDFIAALAPARGERSVRLTSLLAARIFNVTPILYAHQGETRPIGRRVGLGRAREALFAKVRRMVRTNQLLSPHVVVSYAGDPGEVELMPGYQRLVTVARQWDVTVHLAIMAMSNAINVGPHALSVGFIADPGSSLSIHSQD